MAMVYCFQSCSWSGCVPITRYVTRSRGLRIGSSQVLPFASRTCMTYRPIGFVIKARAATKSTSCNQSIERIRVSLEFLGPDELLAGDRMLAFGESRELFGGDESGET